MNQNLNVSAKTILTTIKFLEGNIGETLHDLELGNIFIDMTQNTSKQRKIQ